MATCELLNSGSQLKESAAAIRLYLKCDAGDMLEALACITDSLPESLDGIVELFNFVPEFLSAYLDYTRTRGTCEGRIILQPSESLGNLVATMRARKFDSPVAQ